MRSDAKGHADPHHGGWVAWTAPEFAGKVWVRFVDRGDRLVPVDVVVAGDQGLTANLLRQVPLGRLEAFANGPTVARRLRAMLGREGPDVRAGLPRPRKPKEARDALLAEIEIILQPVAPGAPDHGDDFYRQVADAYEGLHKVTRAPTTTIAEMRGVPVSTAKRWVREARARGFLPPARQGKAG